MMLALWAWHWHGDLFHYMLVFRQHVHRKPVTIAKDNYSSTSSSAQRGQSSHAKTCFYAHINRKRVAMASAITTFHLKWTSVKFLSMCCITSSDIWKILCFPSLQQSSKRMRRSTETVLLVQGDLTPCALQLLNERSDSSRSPSMCWSIIGEEADPPYLSPICWL